MDIYNGGDNFLIVGRWCSLLLANAAGSWLKELAGARG
jgi:hypothetical protein